MTDEAGFLRAILDEPANNDLRLIYADWLEEQRDPVAVKKAEFLRLTVTGLDLLVSPPLQTKEAQVRQQRLQQLAAELDTDWLAVTSHLLVENCPIKGKEPGYQNASQSPFQFLCDRRWQDLRATEDRDVRFCDGCQQQVHYCDTIGEARRHADMDHCIAIDLGIIRKEGDLVTELRRAESRAGRLSAAFLREEQERLMPDPVSIVREQRKSQKTDVSEERG